MRIIDFGDQYGFPTASIFKPWGAEIVCPVGVDEAKAEIKEGVDLVLFGGGADISPVIYRHRNISAFISRQSIVRDNDEEDIWDHCRERDIPMLGICRGSQFVCAKSGGTLVQHLENHGMAGTHEIITHDERRFDMTSTHHQLMYPFEVNHELIAWSERRSPKYTWGGNNPDFFDLLEREPEIVFFPKSKALGVQGHPEYFRDNHPTVAYVRGLVASKLLKKEFN